MEIIIAFKKINSNFIFMSKRAIKMGTVAKAALSHLSNLLQVRRKEKNLTVSELADRLGVSIPTTRNLLSGASSVAVGTYFEAAYILGVPLFDSSDRRFTETAANVQKLEALLPQRVRKSEFVIDDDF